MSRLDAVAQILGLNPDLEGKKYILWEPILTKIAEKTKVDSFSIDIRNVDNLVKKHPEFFPNWVKEERWFAYYGTLNDKETTRWAIYCISKSEYKKLIKSKN